MAAQTPESNSFPYPAAQRALDERRIQETISAAIEKLQSITPATSLPPWKTQNQLFESAYGYIKSLEAHAGILCLTPTPSASPLSPSNPFSPHSPNSCATIPSSPSPSPPRVEYQRDTSKPLKNKTNPSNDKKMTGILEERRIEYRRCGSGRRENRAGPAKVKGRGGMPQEHPDGHMGEDAKIDTKKRKVEDIEPTELLQYHVPKRACIRPTHRMRRPRRSQRLIYAKESNKKMD